MMLTGLDRLVSSPRLRERIFAPRVALLSHPAAITGDFVHAGEALRRVGVEPVMLFGPEHGYGGEAQDMVGVRSSVDVHNIPTRSLYGTTRETLAPDPRDLASFDLLIIDMQDIGTRFYTFVWTALLAMRACVKQGVRVVVLDRPNPIGCSDDSIEGACQDPAFLSFVGLEPLPIRHSLTIGEIIAHFAARGDVSADALTVVQVEGGAAHQHAPSWGRPFVMTSPNMPSYETALVYPGGCLLEGTNISEGRGTTRPFEIVGAPWVDGAALANKFNHLALEGVVARPISFQPMFHKWAKQVCGGVQIHATDLRFRPVAAYSALIALIAKSHPKDFAFRTEPYEFVSDTPAFDLLTGSDVARRMIESGSDVNAIADEVSHATEADIREVQEAREALRRYAA